MTTKRRYKVSLTAPKMGLVERWLVRRATARAQVPAWLIESDGKPTVNEWGSAAIPPTEPETTA